MSEYGDACKFRLRMKRRKSVRLLRPRVGFNPSKHVFQLRKGWKVIHRPILQLWRFAHIESPHPSQDKSDQQIAP